MPGELKGFPRKIKENLIFRPPIHVGQRLPNSIRYRITGGFYPSNALLEIRTDGSARCYTHKDSTPSDPSPHTYTKAVQLSDEIVSKLNNVLKECLPYGLQDLYEQPACDFPFRSIIFLSDQFDKVVEILGPIEFAEDEESCPKCLIQLLSIFAEIFDSYFEE